MSAPRQYAIGEPIPPRMLERANVLERVAFEARNLIDQLHDPAQTLVDTEALDGALLDLEKLP